MSIALVDGITLLSGELFDYENPHLGAVSLDDLAIPLANNCRFAGQLPLGHWYSIAQHAVNASRIVEREFAFEALMHDTAEAFTNDITTPLKVRVPLFKEIEQKIESDMARRFNFRYPMTTEVRMADLQMLAIEMKYLRGQDPSAWAILDGIEFEHLLPLVDLNSKSPRVAYADFISRYEELKPDVVY